MVAGASEGLGAEYARYLASLGFHLILIARRQAQLEAISEELTTKFGVQTKVRVLDLSDTDQLVTYLQNELPDVGLAIYNAAYSPLGYFTETSIEDLHKEYRRQRQMCIRESHKVWCPNQSQSIRSE